jgi:hypothetical protein
MTEINEDPLPGEDPKDDPEPESGPSTAEHSGPQGQDSEAHGGQGAGDSGPEADAQAGSGAVPGAGGYAGLDPKTDMPRVPSVPESQD